MAILLIGCGRMGSAMARSWRDRERILVFDPMAATLPDGVERLNRVEDAPWGGDLVVFLAVKPQAFSGVAPVLVPFVKHAPLIVSIMAGVPLAKLGSELGGTDRVVRAMPNTPAAIGKGIAGAVAGDGVDASDRHRIGGLLSALGDVLWFEEENDLDIVTAVSGSGPAYFFRMAEALSDAGAKAGLSEQSAMRLARATLIGAAALADADERSLAELRQEVTSPGGTTAAGLAVMDQEQGIDVLMSNVVLAAARRSAELAG